jgi:hypothetical protein
MKNCEFLVHLGDIKKGEIACDDEHYELVRDMLLNSAIPSFIVPGDNQWNDCGNNQQVEAAWDRWTDNSMHLGNNWNHTISVVRQQDHPKNYHDRVWVKSMGVWPINIILVESKPEQREELLLISKINSPIPAILFEITGSNRHSNSINLRRYW